LISWDLEHPYRALSSQEGYGATLVERSPWPGGYVPSGMSDSEILKGLEYWLVAPEKSLLLGTEIIGTVF
jgi:hypothetical protein